MNRVPYKGATIQGVVGRNNGDETAQERCRGQGEMRFGFRLFPGDENSTSVPLPSLP